MHALELRHLAQLPYFIGLQTADEVPPQSLDVLRRLGLLGELLHVILPEVALACVVGGLEVFVGFGLADGNQVHLMAGFLGTLVHLGLRGEQVVLHGVEREAAKLNRTVDLLLQVHIATESTKFGFSQEELRDLARPEVWEAYPHLRPVGLMGMATFTDDQAQVREEFKSLRSLFEALKHPLGTVASERGAGWHTLSMGMSGDWPLAVEEGSTMVRVGSAIFGVRNTPKP